MREGAVPWPEPDARRYRDAGYWRGHDRGCGARSELRGGHGQSLVAVSGGDPLTRVLLAEQARLRCAVPVLLVEPDADADRATTLVLSGRTDLVGSDRTQTDDCHTSDS